MMDGPWDLAWDTVGFGASPIAVCVDATPVALVLNLCFRETRRFPSVMMAPARL